MKTMPVRELRKADYANTPREVNTKMLRDALYEKGLSTYQLAAACGVIQPTVSKILNGENSPGAVKLKAICDALDLDINDVFIEEVRAAA